MVYIREAHAADSTRARSGWSKVNDPVDLAERLKVAAACEAELETGIPVGVDGVADRAAKAYDAFPDRLYVVGADGMIAFAGEKGPKGFDVTAMTERLDAILDGD